MPWWIWLLLVLFMIAVLAAGGTYAARRALAALHVVSHTGERISDRLERMTAPTDDVDETARPIFTEPLHVAAERYEQAHATVVRRRQETRDRHVRAWRRWRDAL
ncbi:hypothetical protein [Bifidobacterium aesculapii]|uniref:hypothetical protein n=1 Tax=Bifidobacterium aesculapii TaxID=1329411 RepID=UPI0006E1D56F|nr:hypothetical protein [Bifidobacterium aesculapii]